MEEIIEILPKSNNLGDGKQKEIESFVTFEDALPTIQKLLRNNKHKWQLKIINWLEWEDIEQIVKIHIFKKFHLYNKQQNFSPWANTIINNQLKNIRRNVYDSYSRPCLRCSFNCGGDSCGWTVDNKQDSSCPLFKKWEGSKKYAHDVKLAVSTENHVNEVSEIPENRIDVTKAMKIIHEKIKPELRPGELKVYECLYIQELTEEETCKIMGYTAAENGRSPGYGRISQIKRKIIQKVKKIMDEVDLF